uniref:tRNA (guanine(9)-N(1))-methyltransferase n=1 Tax=Phytophthora ramorum TaxID=164328 RepID=H3GJ05_PHYRM
MRPSTLAVGLVILATCCALGVYGKHSRYTEKCGRKTKQDRREMLRSNRRSRKDKLLKAKKLARSEAVVAERAGMTEEQKCEQRERIRMQRVEQYQKLEEAQLSGIRVVVDLVFAEDQTTRTDFCRCISPPVRKNLLPFALSTVGRHEEPLEQLYDVGELVYLSPDSDNVLETLDPGCVSSVKLMGFLQGETKAKAAAHGIQTARLPLQEHFEQTGARVRTHIMNLDSVIITLNEVANHGDWGRAFRKAVPLRISRSKQAKKNRVENDA